MGAVVIMVALAAGYGGWALKPLPPRAVTRLAIALDAGDIFTAPSALALSPDGNDVSADGKRFLMLKNADAPSQTATAPRIVIVQNWFEELKTKVPTK